MKIFCVHILLMLHFHMKSSGYRLSSKLQASVNDALVRRHTSL